MGGCGCKIGDVSYFTFFAFYADKYWYLWVPCAVLLAVWLVRGIRRGR